jgi:phosphoglycolate phosphatase
VSSAVLFDLDGTLTDPKSGITKCIIHALERMGRPAPDADTLHWCIGPPLTRSFPLLLDDDDPELIAQAISLYRERFSEIGLFENAVYDGVPSMLRSLRTAGVRLFVATSKPTIFAVRILAYFELNGFFQAVYGSELDGTRADKSELINYLLRIEGLTPEQTLMVGDREHDVIGAHRCGLRTIGVRYGYAAAGELERAKAAVICDRPEDVAPVVLRLLGK